VVFFRLTISGLFSKKNNFWLKRLPAVSFSFFDRESSKKYLETTHRCLSLRPALKKW